MRANELSALLWQERELLDLLIFKLTEEQLLLTAGRTRWLQHATSEVERVVDRLRTAGLARVIEVDCLAEEWNVKADQPTLNDIAVAAPPGPWGDIFRAHLEAMTAQAAQIRNCGTSTNPSCGRRHAPARRLPPGCFRKLALTTHMVPLSTPAWPAAGISLTRDSRGPAT